MTALLQLSEVTVVRAGATILDAVTLALDPGERVALVGANGAGKTTLLRTIVGLQPIAAGQITAFGKLRRTERDFQQVRVKVGYLFQDPDDQLFCPTVLEDVAFGPMNLGHGKRNAFAKAQETLENLSLGHLSDRVTHRLSGGEKRLVSLAAVLAMNPEVLLLDEPTNALDERHLEQLTGHLEQLEKAMILVSHDRHFTERLATRAVVLDECRIAPAIAHRHPHVHDHIHFHEREAAPHDSQADNHDHATENSAHLHPATQKS